MKADAIFLYPFYHFHPLHRQLDISWVIAAETSDLRIAGRRNRKLNIWYTLFRIYSFYTCTVAAVVRAMLKTRVTLENIPRALLNLFKRLIFAMFKDSYSLPMPLLLTLTFVLLPYLFGLCHDTYIQLWSVYLPDVWRLHWSFWFSLFFLLFQNFY